METRYECNKSVDSQAVAFFASALVPTKDVLAKFSRRRHHRFKVEVENGNREEHGGSIAELVEKIRILVRVQSPYTRVLRDHWEQVADTFHFRPGAENQNNAVGGQALAFATF